MGSTTKIPFDRIGKNQGAARWNKPVIVPGEMDEAHLKGALLILLSLISGREESTVFCKNDERTGLERMVCEKSRLLGDMILDFISEDLEFLSDGESSCGMETIVCFSREKVDEIDPSWMVFLFEKRKGAVGLSIRYNTSSYTRRMADNVADNFNRIAVGFLDFPEKSVEDTVFPDSLGRDQVLSCFNRSLGIPPLKDSVIKQFERVVDNYPDATALVFGSHKVSYRQLDKMACGVAEKIGELGIKKGEVAAISLGRSVSSIVAMLGIVKLGAAYMPIPASTPTDRALFMLEECEAKILIADNRELFRDISIPVFKIADESIPASSFYPKIEYSPDDLLYILYTSGTTGKPKGIMVENGSVTNALHWYASEYGLGIGKNLIQLSEISFDGSIYQIFGALLNGCTLHIPEKSTVTDMDELYGYIEREEIFLINFVPVILGELLGKRARIESLKYVLSGGDRLDHRIIDDLLEKGYELYNYYGPTETTMDAVRGKCEKEKISIGSPIPGVGCFVLDEKSRPVPVGFPGELYIGGAGVSRGYVKRDEQNRECFIRLPILKNMIVYKTGDLVRWMPNGEIAFIGRNDSQVKLNGYRIELGEVEDLMARFEGVIMAAAKVFQREEGESELIGYLTVEEGFFEEDLRNYMMKNLPPFMVPSRFFRLKQFPLNRNGKIDRRALPEPESVYSDPAEGKTLTERVERIWKNVLGVPNLLESHDFFRLGGDSIKAIRISSLMVSEGMEVRTDDIFRNPVFGEFIRMISGRYVEDKWDADEISGASDSDDSDELEDIESFLGS